MSLQRQTFSRVTRDPRLQAQLCLRACAMAPLELYILTFNCARNLISPHVLGPHLFDALPKAKPLPDLIALSLQEVAPIAYSFLGGSLLTPYLDRIGHALRAAVKCREAEAEVHYQLVVARNVGLTALVVFAKPDVVKRVRWLQTAGVGVGLWEMGNKGAVGVRLCLSSDEDSQEEMELTLVSAHFAPFEEYLLRRNQDWENIVRHLVFSSDEGPKRITGQDREGDDTQPLLPDPTKEEPKLGGLFKSGNHIFFAGDLNYRTSNKGPGPSDYLSFPQPVDADSPQHFLTWLQRDQLSQERNAKRTLHGLEELSVSFPPTYKYSHASAGTPAKRVINSNGLDGAEPDQWAWSRHRYPSWCDRILFAPSHGLQPHIYTSLPVLPTSDHRPVALSVTVPAKSAGNIFEAPFPINPDWRSRRASARRRELIVGLLAYLSLTREGNSIVVGLIAGTLVGWFLIKSLI